MKLHIDNLPDTVTPACIRLRDSLTAILGDNIVALWLYGACVSTNPPTRLGDIDTYCIIAQDVSNDAAAAIDRLHVSIERSGGIEIDGWYVLLADAGESAPPPHAYRPGRVDGNWALHRAHLLAGRCIVMHGQDPQSILRPPTWSELEDALMGELSYVEGLLDHLDASLAAYATLNSCRIVASAAHHDVVRSKRESANWAIERFPSDWHQLIQAAERCYDDGEQSGDLELLITQTPQFISFVRERMGRL